jgi:VIT1/CCC1 family predicted Fe2+/Mn2+ transporter
MLEKKIKNLKSDYLRNLIFGAEDSLVSTVGVLFGIASSAAYTKPQILLTGIVVICVEALSMGAGSFLSEKGAEEVDGKPKPKNLPIIDGIIMFSSYIIFGLLALSPFIFFEPEIGKYFSLAVTVAALLLLGYLPAKNLRSAVRMAVVAGFAVLVGYAIAHIFKIE